MPQKCSSFALSSLALFVSLCKSMTFYKIYVISEDIDFKFGQLSEVQSIHQIQVKVSETLFNLKISMETQATTAEFRHLHVVHFLIPLQNEFFRGYTGISLSVCPWIRLCTIRVILCHELLQFCCYCIESVYTLIAY